MKTMKKIFKRTFTGKPNDNIITSKYMPSYKYALVAIVEKREGRLSGLLTQTFKTKKEAEEYVVEYPNICLDTNEEAVEAFEYYITAIKR